MVANISLSPQNDVRLKRSVVVMWEQPVVRDLNGIITKYRIEYGFVSSLTYTIWGELRACKCTHASAIE